MGNSEKCAEAMQKVITEILEKFAYMFVDPLKLEAIPQTGNDFICARMTFGGDQKGCLTLLVPRPASQAITANILGLEEGDEFIKDHLEDGMKELLNIMGAHILTEVVGEHVNLNINIPQVEPFTDEDWKLLVASGQAVAVLGDSHPIVVQMSMD